MYDVIAYARDGEIYCPDCSLDFWDDSEASPIFSHSSEETIGETCGSCGSCYVSRGSWAAEWWDRESLDMVRWYRCDKCRVCYPIVRENDNKRRESLCGRWRCLCGGRYRAQGGRR